MRLREAQQLVDAWIRQFEEGYWPPLANLARLAEEIGELARELNHRHGSKPKKPGEAPGSVGEELADVLFVVLCLANSLDIDLEQELAGVLAKYRRRDGDRWTRRPQPSPDPAPGPPPGVVHPSPESGLRPR